MRVCKLLNFSPPGISARSTRSVQEEPEAERPRPSAVQSSSHGDALDSSLRHGIIQDLLVVIITLEKSRIAGVIIKFENFTSLSSRETTWNLRRLKRLRYVHFYHFVFVYHKLNRFNRQLRHLMLYKIGLRLFPHALVAPPRIVPELAVVNQQLPCNRRGLPFLMSIYALHMVI